MVRIPTPLILSITPVIALAALTACGGGGGPSPGRGVEVPEIEEPIPDEPKVQPAPGTFDSHTLSEVAPPGSYANRQHDRIKVMVQDEPLDFTQPEFEGRIAIDGASFGIFFQFDFELREAFTENCRPERKCQVYRVKSGGDWDRLQTLVRTVIQTHGQPSENNWYLYDEDRYGWVRLPVHDVDNYYHGTLMGQVITRVAPDAAIVPVALVFKGGIIRGTPDGREFTLDDDEPKLFEILADGQGGMPLDQLDMRLARNWREFYTLADIINSSFGGAGGMEPFDLAFRAEHFADLRAARQWLPQRWRAYTQADVPESERVIRVRPTTNARLTLGLDGRGLEMLEIVNFPELRGHTIGATTGLPPGNVEIGTPCGELPDDWDAARHGRHYCLAAPERSTSHATAYISATLANMMAASRGQVGSLEIVRRLMNTADQTGKFSDSLLYGAGLVDPQAALQAVGRTVTGTSGGEAPVHRTRLNLPSAYGDAARRLSGIEIASFDAWNYPFWLGAGQLIAPSDVPVDPIPRFHEGDAPKMCSPFRLHAAHFNCFQASEQVAGLVSRDGAGASFRLGDGLAVSAVTQGARRLDGKAKGAFSWGSGATLAAFHLEKESLIESSWRAISRMTVAADLPGGIGRSRQSMFDAGPALISSWTLGIAHDRGRSRTALTLSQPPRAESGTARLTYPVGRTRAGQRLYGSRTFSLVPSRRTLTARVTHQRMLGAGEFLVSFQRSENPGHTDAAPSYGAGVAWRLHY